MPNYTNSTYVDLEKLREAPNISIDMELTWDYIDTGIQSIFGTFSWLEVIQSLGIFFILFYSFYQIKVLNLTNMQNVLASSFITLIFNVMMLYSNYYTGFYMFGIMFVVWIGALITTIRDRI